VLGVFPSCVYLGLGEHDTVLALLAHDALLQPIGMRLAVSSGEVRWDVAAGDAIEVGDGRIRLPRGDVVAARVQRPARVTPRSPVTRVAPSSTAHLWTTGPLDLVGSRAADVAGGMLADLAGGVLADLGRDLAAAALGGQPVAPVLQGLIGAGAGLTPSGDDAVAGVLLALRSAGEVEALAAVDDEVRALSHTTTSISAALLRAAGQGYAVPEVVTLVDLLEPPQSAEPTGHHDGAIRSGSSTTAPAPTPSWLSVGPALERVLAIGHSSGRDLVAGLLGARHALADHPSTQATTQEGVLHG
jgi:hypothetical protein